MSRDAEIVDTTGEVKRSRGLAKISQIIEFVSYMIFVPR
jgi:hypothetical protein